MNFTIRYLKHIYVYLTLLFCIAAPCYAQIEAIIFDLDGTIANTEPIWHEGCRSMLHAHDVCITPEIHEVITRSGLHLQDKCQMLKELTHLDEDPEVLRAEIYADLRRIYADQVTFIPGFVAFFSNMPQHLKVAICSNCVDEFINLSVKGLGLRDYFGGHIYGISSVGDIKKPDPTVYLFVAKQLDVAPCNCIAIEDSKTGVQSAKRAGMFCIGIQTSEHFEDLSDADFVVNGYDEINLRRLLS